MQVSVEDAIHRASNYPELFSEMPRYCCPVKTFYLFFSFITMTLNLITQKNKDNIRRKKI